MTNTKINIAIAGDFCSFYPHENEISNALRSELSSHELRIVNFEGPLQIGDLHTAGSYFLKQSKDSPSWCLNNGFNIINLANNHAYDFGKEGLKATKQSFGNILTLGSGYWDEVYSVTRVEISGKKIGFFSATSADLSSLKDRWTDLDKYGCPWIKHPCVNKVIADAKSKLDYLIVIVHAGVEYMDVPLPEWRDRYYELVDMGADAVVATHAHVPQGFEYYSDKPIFYSLGNFCFYKGEDERYPERWNNGIIASLEICEDRIHAKAIQTFFKNKIVDIDNSKSAKEYLDKLNSYLKDNEKYLKRVDENVINLYKKYEEWLLLGMNSYKIRPLSLRNVYHLLRALITGGLSQRVALHQLREESTRYVLARAYKLLSKTNL